MSAEPCSRDAAGDRREAVTRLVDGGLTVVYRRLAPEPTVRLSAALAEVGVRSFEVTMTGEEPFRALRALRRELGADARIGAGTVTTTAEVDRAAEAGAEFVVSPHTDAEVVSRTRARGLVSVPGALTPTEIVAARAAGADVVKVFPISTVGAGYLRQLRGPMPDLVLMVSGGLDPSLATECVAAGAAMLAVGSAQLGADPDGRFDPSVLRSRVEQYRG